MTVFRTLMSTHFLLCALLLSGFPLSTASAQGQHNADKLGGWVASHASLPADMRAVLASQLIQDESDPDLAIAGQPLAPLSRSTGAAFLSGNECHIKQALTTQQARAPPFNR
ncbi:hypothetical protein [Pseudohongiella spirulinae]|uniref:Uncharacterized protein n=1 Tax=Pseudohongiella spirulinae TaxID=1249552 RepID=A0A0S2KC94_9GAMM|nr:hypothetical protein [Pseudohongiella spirulinae]ALO45952.1 hypothetical protein PS2015_1294 [Pseudohongiella spirulinae]